MYSNVSKPDFDQYKITIKHRFVDYYEVAPIAIQTGIKKNRSGLNIPIKDTTLAFFKNAYVYIFSALPLNLVFHKMSALQWLCYLSTVPLL